MTAAPDRVNSDQCFIRVLDNQRAIGFLAPVSKHVVNRLIKGYRRLPSRGGLQLGAIGPDDGFVGRPKQLGIDFRDYIAPGRALENP